MKFFENLSSLVSDMKNKDWLIELFNFTYNARDYFVMVKLYLPEENRPKFSLAKIIFIDKEDNSRKLVLDASSADFIDLNVKEFRTFFHIPYVEGKIGDAIRTFKQHFGQSIPLLVHGKNNSEKEFIYNYIDIESGENRGRYLSHVKRLPDEKRRKELTGFKAKLLRPEVYAHFKDDMTITFVFFAEKKNEHTLDEILKLFSKS